MGPKSRFSGKPVRGRPGRGRGRGSGRNFGRRPKFDSERVAPKEQAIENEQTQEELEPEDGLDGTDQAGSEDDEQEAQNATRPYMALMMSFAESTALKAKRRKLEHSETQPRREPENPAAEEDPPGDIDVVDAQEDEEDIIAEDLSDDDDEQPDASDPFETHFADPNENNVAERLKAIKNNEWAVKKIASASVRTVLTLPKTGVDDSSSTPSYTGPSDLNIKSKLRDEISSQRPKFDQLEQRVASLLFQYHDTLFCERTVENAERLRRLACLHAVNHVFKTRDRVLKNNAKAAREDANDDIDLRDQGFTRPKVLILLPTRQSCVKMVDMICSLCRPQQQENRKRFDDSYIDKEVKFSDDKPADFRDLFEGNDDDMFRLGLKFTRKTIKYFAQFYQSDIILASPLGLRMAIGSEEEKEKKNKVDFDFLSSIEMVIVDQADALLMQNWDHVDYIFEHLNLQPKEAHGCDFSRVRPWYLDINAKYFRQNIIFSAFNTPELSELVRSHCPNWRGKARVQPEYPGVIGQLGVRAKQTFSRFDSSSVEDDPDKRFAYFTKAVVPSLVKRAKDSSGTLVFIPSYLDFVRVRNYFATSTAVANLSFGTISEYAEASEASRARSHFITGRHRVLLYTERAHHFRRYQLRGVRSVIMYGLPDNPLFYKEMTGGYLGRSEEDLKLEPGQGSVKVMFSKYDVVKLERIVGSQRVGKMIRERSDTFVFEEEKVR